jgi:hypothetical protein
VTLSQRPAFALLSTLIAILLLTALTSATLLRASTDTQITSTTTLRHQAFFAADRALWTSLTQDNATYRALPLYHTVVTTTTTPTHTTRIHTTRADTTLYWIVASTTLTAGPHRATRRLALSARLTSDSTLAPLTPNAWIDLY